MTNQFTAKTPKGICRYCGSSKVMPSQPRMCSPCSSKRVRENSFKCTMTKEQYIEKWGKKCFECEKCGGTEVVIGKRNGYFYRRCKSCRRKWELAIAQKQRLRYEYGMTVEQYNELRIAQDCKCAICGKPETPGKTRVRTSLFVDHCHDTGKVRGLLCNKCNTGIGMLGDKIEHMESALAYLKKHKPLEMSHGR